MNNKENIASNKIKLHEGNWYYNFKNEVFIRCLKRLYSQKLDTLIDSIDASSSANLEWLDYNVETIRIIDSLAEGFVKRPQASWTIENRKITMNICISYRNSTELDKVAVFFYRKSHSLNSIKK
jgi:hypothetical protein